MEYALELSGVGKKYENFYLKDINFTLEPGVIMGLIGTNGAGKTTLIQLILGLLQKKEGSIRIFGLDNTEQEKEAKDLCGFVLDDNPFLETLSAKANAKLYGPYYSNWDEEIFFKYCKKFDVPIKKSLRKLSQGTIIKFQLAFALSHDAKLLVFDEPSAGLDPIFRRELIDIMYDIIMEGRRSILFSTHLTNDLDWVADYITMLHEGKQLFSLPKEELLDSYQLVRGSENQINAIAKEVIVGRRVFETYCEALVKQTKDEIRIPVDVSRPTIEDVMYYLVK